MSIYLLSKKIDNHLRFFNVNYDINVPKRTNVACAKKGNKYVSLDFDNYTEEKLRDFVKNEKHTDVKVDYNFWDYNFCNENQLRRDDTMYFCDFKTGMIDLSKFPVGYLVTVISMYNILLNTLVMKDEVLYEDYLNEAVIVKNFFAEFIINKKIVFPLTHNYLELLTRIFNEDNIFNLLFQEKPMYPVGEISTILKRFKGWNINEKSIFIFEMRITNLNKLIYTNLLLDLYEDNIDRSYSVFYDTQVLNPSLGFYLFTLPIDNKLTDYYFKTMKHYLDKNGARYIDVINDRKLNDEIKNKSLVLKDTFINEYATNF